MSQARQALEDRQGLTNFKQIFLAFPEPNSPNLVADEFLLAPNQLGDVHL